MPNLDAALSRFLGHPGVEHVVLLGRDGLVVRHFGTTDGVDEAIAASVPALVAATGGVGASTGMGELATAVLDFERGVLIVLPVSVDLSIAVLVRPGFAFAPLLRELRSASRDLINLL